MDALFSLTADEIATLSREAWWVASDDAVFSLTGPGTVACVQGLFTNDIVRPGPSSLLWGALLTPKGAIISDLWVARQGDAVQLIVPAAAQATVATLLARSFPPRLTTVRDVSATTRVYRCHHPAGAEALPPEVLRPLGPAPFTGLLLAPLSDTPAPLPLPAPWLQAPAVWQTAREVMLGWPVLGREIDERTLVQEVRFDALEGVRYDKGCYTGQETVARLHFRGHANRLLQPLRLSGVPTDTDIHHEGRSVGRLSSWGTLASEVIGLGVVRREVLPGQEVLVGGVTALVTEFPGA